MSYYIFEYISFKDGYVVALSIGIPLRVPFMKFNISGSSFLLMCGYDSIMV